MNRYMLFMALAIAASPSALAGAPSCRVGTLKQVATLAALPASLAALVGAGRPGVDGIAEHDEPFNLTDVVDATLPMRRFVLAAVGEHCAIVAIEHGGRAYGVDVDTFQRAAGTWRQVGRRTRQQVPRTLADLRRDR